jgi:hypothetical protein
VLTERVVCEILAATVTPPPESLAAMGVTHWSSRRLAEWLRHDKKIIVSHDSISRLWRRFCLQPHRSEGFKFSTDPLLDSRPGGPKTVLTDEVVCEILAATVTPPPESLRAAGVTHWSSRRLAGWLHRAKGISVSHDSISVLWRKFCLAPHRGVQVLH